MTNHPTPGQLAEYHADLLGFFKSLGIRLHLKHCALCQDILREIESEEEEQKAFAAEALRYSEAESQAEETLQELTAISDEVTQKQ